MRNHTKIRIFFLILSLNFFILACQFWGKTEPDEPQDFPSVQTIAALTVESELGRFDSLASQTAVAEQTASPAAETAVDASPTPSSTPPPPTAVPTATPVPPSLTPTTAWVAPTLTFTPVAPYYSPTPTLASERISFKPGGTTAYLQETIQQNQSQVYSLRAAAGQTLIVNAVSSNNDVYLSVHGKDTGVILVSPAAAATSWMGVLPSSQVYEVRVSTTAPQTVYFMSVEVPADIRFDWGAISKTMAGTINVDAEFHPGVLTRVRYLAVASAGQTMTVRLDSPNIDDLSVAITGQQNGQGYLAYQVKNAGGTVNLPLSQGYFIDVYAVNGVSTTFSLEVKIE